MLRAEARRGGEEHDVHLRIDHLLEGVEAEVLRTGFDHHARCALGSALEGLEALIDLRLVDVGDRGEFGGVVGGKRLSGRTATASAAAYQADFDGIGHALGADNGGKARRKHSARGLQKVAAFAAVR